MLSEQSTGEGVSGEWRVANGVEGSRESRPRQDFAESKQTQVNARTLSLSSRLIRCHWRRPCREPCRATRQESLRWGACLIFDTHVEAPVVIQCAQTNLRIV